MWNAQLTIAKHLYLPPPLVNWGPCFYLPKNSGVPVKIFLPVTACSCSTPFGIPSCAYAVQEPVSGLIRARKRHSPSRCSFSAVRRPAVIARRDLWPVVRIEMGVRRDLLLWFVLLYGMLYCNFGLSSPFLPEFLTTRGIGAEWLGFLLGAGTAVRLLSAPFAGRLADVFGTFR